MFNRLTAQKSENTRVAAIMVNDSGKLEGNAIKAGNIIGQVGKISGHIHEPTSTACDEEKGMRRKGTILN